MQLSIFFRKVPDEWMSNITTHLSQITCSWLSRHVSIEKSHISFSIRIAHSANLGRYVTGSLTNMFYFPTKNPETIVFQEAGNERVVSVPRKGVNEDTAWCFQDVSITRPKHIHEKVKAMQLPFECILMYRDITHAHFWCLFMFEKPNQEASRYHSEKIKKVSTAHSRQRGPASNCALCMHETTSTYINDPLVCLFLSSFSLIVIIATSSLLASFLLRLLYTPHKLLLAILFNGREDRKDWSHCCVRGDCESPSK